MSRRRPQRGTLVRVPAGLRGWAWATGEVFIASGARAVLWARREREWRVANGVPAGYSFRRIAAGEVAQLDPALDPDRFELERVTN